ncbi:hypothetical protein EG346_14810 [Chryseobacterium carnipullorum]|uniref:Uncharacterized protein n=1 Tax=Chryseobacterium carnipullorum TaxID=1124835 RepID=A0A376DSV6_CHRCU|nr:hypothetical protein EG346_14810 [Chryseobacterium carnipullorum]AZA64255.1 hypothetical protein EG345_05740 [Chryseobacterium carnipullorum]STC94222.1 Uncharacterised protein [Chryseobacterium carnipullorum]
MVESKCVFKTVYRDIGNAVFRVSLITAFLSMKSAYKGLSYLSQNLDQRLSPGQSFFQKYW